MAEKQKSKKYTISNSNVSKDKKISKDSKAKSGSYSIHKDKVSEVKKSESRLLARPYNPIKPPKK